MDALTTPALSLVYPFYRNRGMLATQYATWASYPDSLKAILEVVLIDDGSPADEDALGVPRPYGLPLLRLYRVLEDRPWHQHAARNLGAKEALAGWLFLSDIDHVLPAASLEAIVPRLNHDVVYTFARLDAPDLRPKLKDGRPHPHPNTFLMTKRRYWEVGGYDEDCTGYGTDGFFRQRLLFAARQPVHLFDVPIVRYSRDVIPDASTRTLERKPGRTSKADLRALLRQKAERGEGPKVLDFAWEQVL